MGKPGTCSIKVMYTMKSSNLGVDHEQSHDNHTSIRTVTAEFAKFAIKEVIFLSKSPIGRYRIANCLEDKHLALIVRLAAPGYRQVAMTSCLTHDMHVKWIYVSRSSF